jgi:hypothetical protein
MVLDAIVAIAAPATLTIANAVYKSGLCGRLGLNMGKAIRVAIGMVIGFVLGLIAVSYWNDPGYRPVAPRGANDTPIAR